MDFINRYFLLALAFWGTGGTIGAQSLPGLSRSQYLNDTSYKWVRTLSSGDFPSGHVVHGWQWLQARLPGLLVSRPGGDPNTSPDLRYRGLSSLGLGPTQPLVVIDGVPGLPIEHLDPLDIRRIRVLQGADAALYGIRGASGVIEVETWPAPPSSQPTQIRYRGYVAWENMVRNMYSLDADSYRRFSNRYNRGFDAGASTDWMEEVTRLASSHTHHLSLQGAIGSARYYSSVSFRDVQGVAQKSGHRQLYGNLRLQQQALNQKLTLTLGLQGRLRNTEDPHTKIFEQAIRYNPTAPVYEAGSPYDGFYQLPRFDYYNPRALLAQQIHEGREEETHAFLRAAFRPWEGIQVLGTYALGDSRRWKGDYFDKEDYYRGNAFNGLAEQTWSARKASYLAFSLLGAHSWGRLSGGLVLGYEQQAFTDNGFFAANSDFLTDLFGFNNLGVGQGIKNGLGSVGSYKHRHLLEGGYFQVRSEWDSTFALSAVYRREGSSRLGADNKWGNFWGASARWAIHRHLNIPALSDWVLQVDYSQTGNTPQTPYLSQRVYDWEDFEDRWFPYYTAYHYKGTFLPQVYIRHNENPGLRHERQEEWDLTLLFNLKSHPVRGSLSYFDRQHKDLILDWEVPTGVNGNLSSRSYLNQGAIHHRGMELSLSGEHSIPGGLHGRWQVAFTEYLSQQMVAIDRNPQEDLLFRVGNPGSPGCCSSPLLRWAEGQPVGDFWGPVIDKIDENGRVVYRDLDQDGTADPFSDATVLGNAFPRRTLGLYYQLSRRNWTLDLVWDGVFGHSVYNLNRLIFENLYSGMDPYNLVKTRYFNPALQDYPEPASDLFVEKASYLRWAFTSLSYQLSPAKGPLPGARLYLGVQNLFTWTRYTGDDPSVRLLDTRTTGQTAVVSPGIDRRDQYPTSRIWTLGVEVKL